MAGIWQFLFDSDNYIQCLLYLRGKVAYIILDNC